MEFPPIGYHVTDNETGPGENDLRTNTQEVAELEELGDVEAGFFNTAERPTSELSNEELIELCRNIPKDMGVWTAYQRGLAAELDMRFKKSTGREGLAQN
jgi:hypothetical protein